ncbi:MAG TPA: thermonuclease family protein [Dehalococcoidales bacterium]|nr:thermonuclease family protein [Dehalococcoidales bacterium]
MKQKIFWSVLLAVLLIIPACQPGTSQTIPNTPSVSWQTDFEPSAATSATPSTEQNSAFETGFVVRIIDGDTIEVNIDGRLRTVRYIGIDAPELERNNQPAERFSREAKEKNEELVMGKRVRLEKDVSETDRFNRLLRYVYVDDIFINAELVRNGLAAAVPYPPDIKYQAILTDLAKQAKNQRLGIYAP